MLPTVKIAGSVARNDRFGAPTCLVSSLWFSCGFAVSMGEAAKPLLFEGFQAGCHVVLRGKRGILWHSNVFDNMSKNVKIGGSLVRNADFSASTRLVSSLWFSCGVAVSMREAAKPVLLSCCQLWKLPEVSHEMIVLVLPRKWLWFSRHARRVYGGSYKTSLFRRFPSRLSCRFAWQAWHFVTFQAVW